MRRRNDKDFTTHDEVGGWYDQKFTEMGGSWHVPPEEIDELLDLLNPEPVANDAVIHVLELGCGDGKIMERMLLRDWAAAGNDISEVARRMARERLEALTSKLPYVAPWIVVESPMERLGFVDASFDAVICYGSMEHALSIPRAVTEMSRVLRPGGRYLNYAPNEEWMHDDQPLETTMTESEWCSLLLDDGRLFVEKTIRRGDNTIYIGSKPY